MTEELGESLVLAKTTTEFKPSVTMPRPAGTEWLFYFAGRKAEARFTGPAWKVMLGIVSGEVRSVAIIVREPRDTGVEPTWSRDVLAVWHNPPSPVTSAVWFNDATASPERLESVLGMNIIDKTPDERIELVQRAIQVP